MAYVDGYLLPIPRKAVKQYQKIAQKAGKIWREHGALDYKECVGDDLAIKGMRSFVAAAGSKKSSEVVVFAYVVYRSKKHRDQVNARVMKDARLHAICDPKKMPFDPKRMAYGGFKVFVDPK